MPQVAVGATPPKGILELDRFTEASVDRWNEVSADLDELNNVLHFNLEPERRRRRPELIAALQQVKPQKLEFESWVRIVDYQWTLHPLSAVGSLTYVGGRFNAGQDLDRNTLDPWPALYVAEDHPTAYREKFQIQAGQMVDGLSPEELALNAGTSHSTVVLRGKLTRIFNMLSHESLDSVAKVLGRIKMPQRAEQIKRKLKIKQNDLRMITTSKHLFDAAAIHNWRILPIQFGLPAPSQILAELIREADFEAIAYRSTKGGGICLAIFVDRLASGSFVELVGKHPDGVIGRLDESTADQLAGWTQSGMVRTRS